MWTCRACNNRNENSSCERCGLVRGAVARESVCGSSMHWTSHGCHGAGGCGDLRPGWWSCPIHGSNCLGDRMAKQ